MKILQILLILSLQATPLFSQELEATTDTMTLDSFHPCGIWTELKDNNGMIVDRVERIQVPINMDLSVIGLGDKDKWEILNVFEHEGDMQVAFNEKLDNRRDIERARKHFVIYYSEHFPTEDFIEYRASGIGVQKIRWKAEDNGFYTLIYRQGEKLVISIFERRAFDIANYSTYVKQIPNRS